MSTTVTATLILNLTGYWHAGGGRGTGFHLDACCDRDHEQLPWLAGRQLRGLLRHAVRKAEAWGWYKDLTLPTGPAPSFEQLLFGAESQAASRHQSFPGLLCVDSARLPAAERAALVGDAGLRALMFDELFSTAINDKGSAETYSLRGTEVAIPMVLEAQLSLQLTAQHEALRQQQQQAIAQGLPLQVVEKALPLLDCIGAKRTRGLGEVIVTLQPQQGKVA